MLIDERMEEVRIIGFPISLGSGRMGTELGPNAIRYAGLVRKLETLGIHVEDQGDISIDNGRDERSLGSAKNLSKILKYDKILSEKVASALARGKFPLVLGGDHSMALGSMAGLSAYAKSKCGVIYFDAHADFNTPKTTTTGNVHGMPLALACGQYDDSKEPMIQVSYADPKKTVIVGARSVDRKEEELIDRSGAHIFTTEDIERDGMAQITSEAIKIASKGGAAVHVSLDIDVIDPAFVHGTGTPVIGGLMTRELKLALSDIYKSGVMNSFEIAEVNPSLDKNNVTVSTALELVLVALGKKTYESLL